MSDQPGMSTRVNRGLAWIGVASAVVGICDLVAIVLILKFWVSKELYGIATMAAFLFPILDQATDLGLTAALVQRDDVDEEKASTVFWIAAALMAWGVWLHLTEHHEHEHVHEPMEHSHRHVHDAHHQHEHAFPWAGDEPHEHTHRHEVLVHKHPHFPDIHHRHSH